MTPREQALAIWQAAVAAVQPGALIGTALQDPTLGLCGACRQARRILVVGGGKAGAAMAQAVTELLPECVSKMQGVVNVPDEAVQPAGPLRLHGARPAGTNSPTVRGVGGTRTILDLVRHAGPDDVVLCLLSGGGSALLPAPAEGITLEDKQQVTQLLHASGATINEMNCVRKHLSDFKGGRLAQAFRGRWLFSLIISDVIGDPLDVIASGPTAADPSTFADAFAVIEKYGLAGKVPPRVLEFVIRGGAGEIPETLKKLPDNVRNIVIGNNAMALAAAQRRAEEIEYRVLNLGSYIEGETREVATMYAGIARSMVHEQIPFGAPACLLSGGETTVTLVPDHGSGGRNQEFVLACLAALAKDGLDRIVILSGGTDGEDGPTDAAGAIADADTLKKAEAQGMIPRDFLMRNDAYCFFGALGALLRTGLTDTNVMDVRVVLIT